MLPGCEHVSASTWAWHAHPVPKLQDATPMALALQGPPPVQRVFCPDSARLRGCCRPRLQSAWRCHSHVLNSSRGPNMSQSSTDSLPAAAFLGRACQLWAHERTFLSLRVLAESSHRVGRRPAVRSPVGAAKAQAGSSNEDGQETCKLQNSTAGTAKKCCGQSHAALQVSNPLRCFGKGPSRPWPTRPRAVCAATAPLPKRSAA